MKLDRAATPRTLDYVLKAGEAAELEREPNANYFYLNATLKYAEARVTDTKLKIILLTAIDRIEDIEAERRRKREEEK